MDEVFKQTKSCGPFQVWTFIVTNMGPGIPAAMTMAFMSFGFYNPGWTCQPKLTVSHTLNFTTSFNAVTPWNDTSGRSLAVSVKDDNSTNEQHVVSSSCDSANLCESAIFHEGASTIVTEWGLVCDKDWIPRVIISVQMTGDLVGSVMAGEIGDRWGRKTGIFGFIFLLFCTTVVSIFSPSWQVYAAIRFFVGFGTGGIVAVMLVYPYEFLSEKWRVNVLGVPVWNSLFVVNALFVWLLRDWRHIHIATAAMAVVVFIPIFCTPESLRWSAVHGKRKQVAAVTKMIVRMNGSRKPSQDIVEEIFKKKLEPVTSTHSYWTLFKNGMWTLTIRVGLSWLLISFIYFVLYFGIKALSGNFYLNLMIVSVCGLPKGLLAVPTTRLLGRTRSSGLLYCLSALVLTTVVLVDYLVPAEKAGLIITGLALTMNCILETTWDILAVLTAELFPTVVRAHAISFAAMSARVGGILAPVLIPEDSTSLRVPFAIMAGISLVSCGIMLSLPETRHKELEDTLEVEIKISRRNVTKPPDQGDVEGERMLDI